MIPLDLSGKLALVTGVGDNVGFAWYIAYRLSLSSNSSSECMVTQSGTGHTSSQIEQPMQAIFPQPDFCAGAGWPGGGGT